MQVVSPLNSVYRIFQAEWFYDEINKSREFPYTKIRSAIQKNPIRIAESPDESLKQVTGGRALVFIQVGISNLIICNFQDDSDTFFKSIEYCGLTNMQNGMPIVKVRLIFAKNSTFVDDVDRVIKQNPMMLRRLTRKYLDQLQQLDRRRMCVESHTAIGILPYIGVLIVCLFLVATASLIFFGEIFSKCNFLSSRNLNWSHSFVMATTIIEAINYVYCFRKTRQQANPTRVCTHNLFRTIFVRSSKHVLLRQEKKGDTARPKMLGVLCSAGRSSLLSYKNVRQGPIPMEGGGVGLRNVKQFCQEHNERNRRNRRDEPIFCFDYARLFCSDASFFI